MFIYTTIQDFSDIFVTFIYVSIYINILCSTSDIHKFN